VDTSGNKSVTNTVSFVYVVTAPLGVQTNGVGMVSPNYNGQQLEMGKSFTMVATAGNGFAFVNWTGSLTTNTAKFSFVMASHLTFTANFKDITRPVNIINTPTANQRWSNNVFTATGKAGDNAGVTAVFYQLNTDSWRTALTANIWTNWTANLTLTPGSNIIRTYAVDAAGNVSLTNTVKLVYVLTDWLTVQTTGSGTVSPNYNGKNMEIGKTFSMTATAVKGFAFLNWTSSLTANAAKLTFVMASNLTFTANFVEVTRPVNIITLPAVNKTITNASFTATGKASDNVGITNVWYQLNGTSWYLVTTTNLFTNWTAPGLIPVTGSNMFQAFAMDAAGNVSLTNSVKFSH
jgi:Divergent InlB B-repeat domain/Bacterial Ig domain